MARRINFFMGKQRYTGASADTSAAQASALFQSSMDDLMRSLDSFIQEMEGVLPEILIEALEPTFGKSLEQVPQDTGDLHDSGYLEAERYYGGSRVSMGYDKGGRLGYAIFVHEMPYKHAAPTKSKFLQDPLDEDYFTILSAIPRLVGESAGTL